MTNAQQTIKTYGAIYVACDKNGKARFHSMGRGGRLWLMSAAAAGESFKAGATVYLRNAEVAGKFEPNSWVKVEA